MFSMKTKIIISTDCALNGPWHNPDDALALAYILQNPNVEVISIITTFGNTSEKNVYNSITKLSNELGNEPHIVRGARDKYDNCNDIKAYFNHNTDVNDCLLLSIGPTTNLARIPSAVLNSFNRIIVMGGSLSTGNIPPFFTKEFNFWKDHKSTSQIINNNREIELIPLDSTKKTYLSKSLIDKVTNKWPILGKKINDWDIFHGSIYFSPSNPHDLVAAILATNPEKFIVADTKIKSLNGRLINDKNGFTHKICEAKNPDDLIESIFLTNN